MATLTTNLFHGTGEGDLALDVVEGHWPADVEGAVFIVGPDKREPGGHWFGEHGIVHRIDCRPRVDGRIATRAKRVATPIERLRRRYPKLFKRWQFVEVSPFGVTNLANTNVQAIDGRLFIGYDAGRPVEIDPETLEYLTPVGANDEWYQASPAVLEPLVSVAAHPAPAFDERALYFVNYSPLPGGGRFLARWGLTGPVERWPLDGMGEFDSIHDIKATRDHLVICDLPFVMDPATFKGGERTMRNQLFTRLWIVKKADLRATPPGRPLAVTEVQIPFPTGHLSVDHDNPAGQVVVNLEHIPLADLMISIGADTVDHRNGERIDGEYEGMIATAVQPGAVGRYVIDDTTGEVLDGDVAWDDRFWGAVLATKDESTPEARAHVRELWYAGCGFDPDLVPEDWWRLYHDAPADASLVPPDELPSSFRPGALAHFDLESMKVTDVYEFDDGAFPSPPTFVPRTGGEPGDGYVVVLVHRDGDKEVQVFDARDVGRGPLARATAPGFNPNLLLHSCWMPPRPGPRPSDYKVPVRRDVVGAVRSIPSVLRDLMSLGREVRRQAAAPAAAAR